MRALSSPVLAQHVPHLPDVAGDQQPHTGASQAVVEGYSPTTGDTPAIEA